MIAALLGASIGVPYAMSRMQRGMENADGEKSAVTTEESAGKAADTASAAPSGATASIVGIAPTARTTSNATASNAAANVSQDATPILLPQQVLRFDLTKQWVYRTWPRKTTGPTDVCLQSVRVPLVTGTRVHDLAGSLTYFFNMYGQVEHISFRGRTGDTSPLVRFLVATYEFRPEAAPPGEQLYQVKRTSRPQSELRARAEPVLRSDSPHSSYAVELELARPGSRRLLPPRGVALTIPAVAASTPVATGSAASEEVDTDSAESGESASYLEKVRFATPEEEFRVQRFRWPD